MGEHRPARRQLRRVEQAVLGRPGFHLHYAQEGEDLRDRFMADSLVEWQRRTGHKAMFWGANVHVAASEQVRYAFPPTVQAARLVPVGHWLRQQYGTGYVAVAGIFGSDEVLQGFETGRPAVYRVREECTTILTLLGRGNASDLTRDAVREVTW